MTIKNFRNENYLDTMNFANKAVFNKNFKSDYIFNINITMKEILIVINSNSRVVKYKKTKQIKFNSIEIIEISKKFKKLTQIIKEQLNFVNVIKQILNTFIKIQLYKLFNIFFELFKQMFRNITNKKIKTILKKKKIIASSKAMKKKKMHINLMKFNSTKSMHLKKIVACVVFLRFIYVIVYSIINVIIENVKTKTMFNIETKINCIFKRLIDVT